MASVRDRLILRHACALFVLAMVSSTAEAQTGSTVLVAPKLEDADGRRVPFTLGFKLESTVGQGTFVADEYARNSLVVWGASIAPGYRPTDDLMLSVYAKVTQELTDSDVDTQRQHLALLDANMRADYALGTIPVAEIKTGVGLWLYLPTSDVSQFETLMLGAALRLTLNRKLGEHFALDFIGTFRKNFHEYESPVLDASASSPSPVFIRPGGAEDLAGTLVAVGANNVSHFFYNIGWVTWMPIEHMAVILAYGMTNSFTYPTRRDALSSMYAVDGAGQRDSAVGVIEVAYEIDKRFGIGAGITTASAPKSEDNQSFRFPFYDFEGTARNLTLFFIDITISEPLGG